MEALGFRQVGWKAHRFQVLLSVARRRQTSVGVASLFLVARLKQKELLTLFNHSARVLSLPPFKLKNCLKCNAHQWDSNF